MLFVVTLSVISLTVIALSHYAGCCNTKCHSADCRGALKSQFINHGACSIDIFTAVKKNIHI